MKKLLFISLFASLLAAGCSKDEGPGGQGPKIPGNEIWYTSFDGEIVEPYSGVNAVKYPFGDGVEIVSNTYENGKGIIKFSAPVTKIGSYAFRNCHNLTSVTIPESVTTIGYNPFERCSGLTAFYGKFASDDNRCLIVDGVLNSFVRAGLTEYAIPDGVTEIGYGAFSDCYGLTSVTIPDSVTTIGRSAFDSCYVLTSVTIPDNVTTIEEYAFRYCRSLTSITIPDRVTEIGFYAFQDCSSLKDITIPESVTTIGDNPFEYCDGLTAFYGKFASEDNRCLIVDGVLKSFAPAGLTEYTIPDSVTTIGDSAFISCDALKSITIPDGVTAIEFGAFYGCSSLTSITIPDSVTKIENYAFFDCNSLTSVYCRATTPPALGNDRVFKYYDNDSYKILENLTAIYVPRASVEAYKATQYWSDYADLIEPYDF